MDRYTIGERAAAEIRRTASKNDITYSAELCRIGIGREQLYQWERGKCNPTGVILQRMALAGYNVMYILLGDEYGK